MPRSTVQLPTSVAKVSYWHIPEGGTRYDLAEARYAYFDDMEEAKAFEAKYDFPPELAVLIPIGGPKCKHCAQPVLRVESQWHSNAPTLPQYCWVDPSGGSQLHEV